MSAARRAWWISADRRAVDPGAVRAEARAVAEGIEGMSARDLDGEGRPDEGRYRDFIPVAAIEHEDEAALEYAAELILEAFGWRVDLRPAPSHLSE